MVLRIKNFNILGVHWKIRLLGGRCSRNTNAERELPKKGGLDSLLNSRGGLGKKEGGGVFLRVGWYPNAHYTRHTQHRE